MTIISIPSAVFLLLLHVEEHGKQEALCAHGEKDQRADGRDEDRLALDEPPVQMNIGLRSNRTR